MRLFTKSLLAIILLASAALAQDQLSYGQQVYLMKQLKPSLRKVAIMSYTFSDESVDAVTRAGLGQGVTVIVGRLKSSTDLAPMYKRLVAEKGAEFIWIPDAADERMTGPGFEFLREQAPIDNIGLFVPTTSMVDAGGLCTARKSNDVIELYVNKRMAAFLNLVQSATEQDKFRFVVK